MKLATKKFFHNVLAIAVSICMVCTMTPSLAWATSGSGDSASEVATSTTISDGSGKATGESIVKGKVKNKNFAFNGVAPNANYEKKDKFVETLTTDKKPLWATMPLTGIPENYTVSWYIQEVRDNPDYDSNQGPSVDNPQYLRPDDAIEISKIASTKADVPTEDNVPTFIYPSTEGMIVQPADLSMDAGKKYEFSIVMTDEATGDKADAETIISLSPDYPEQVIGNEDNPVYSVWGDIYIHPFPTTDVAKLEVTPLDTTDSNYQKVVEQAVSNPGGPESVEGVTQLTLINNDIPEGTNLYTGTLDVRLPVPEALGEVTQGDTVNVYVVDEEGNVSKKTGTIVWSANPNSDPIGKPIIGEDGEQIPAISVQIEGTGAVLGAFAVGVPANGTYTVTAKSSEGGQISPAGKQEFATGTTTTFSAYAIAPHYKFVGFTLKVNNVEKTIKGSDLGYNSLTIKPSDYGIVIDSSVEVIANFATSTTPGNSAVTIDAAVKKEGSGDGFFTVTPLLVKGMKTPGGSAIVLRQQLKTQVTVTNYMQPTKVDQGIGLLLTFEPSAGSRVKSVTINNKPAAFQGNSLMIGAVENNGSIVVTFESGQQAQTSQSQVQVAVQKREADNYESYPAYIVGDDGAAKFDVTIPVNTGGELTVNAVPYKDIYELEHVYVHSPAGSEQATDIIKHVYVSPNTTASNYPQDEIQLYNITGDTSIELVYKIRKAYLGGTQVTGGSWGWIPGGGAEVDEDAVVNPSAAPVKVMAKAASSAYATPRALDQYKTGTLRLEKEGQYACLVIRADEGYQIGDVKINGARVNNLLTYREDANCYTITVYLGAVGTAPAGIEYIAGYAEPNQIFYTNANTTGVEMTFNPSAIEIPTYNLITTSVTEFGGGTVTPTHNVANGDTAIIRFFPDKGYMLDSVWVNNRQMLTNDRDNLHLMPAYNELDITDVYDSYNVRVSFKPGEPEGGYEERVTVTSTAGAGGSITPYGTFPVYKGVTRQFVLVPNTGYSISSVRINGETYEEGDKAIFVEGKRNVIEVADIQEDTTIAVQFMPMGSASDVTSYTVKTAKEGKGSISPSSATNVASGGDATFSIIPEDGWYVRDVRAAYGSGENASEVSLLGLYDAKNFTFTFTDVRADVTVKAVFAQGENGKIPGTDEPLPSPPGDDKKIHLGDLQYNPGRPNENPGALLTPSLSELEIIKEDGTNHAVADQMFTVTVMDGYELLTPIVENGIKVKDGSGNTLKAVLGESTTAGDVVKIEQVSDGIYTVTVPKNLITDGLSIELNTQAKTASTEASSPVKIDISVTGQGYVTPGMTKTNGEKKTVQVQKGKNQTFNFFPDKGWKVFAAYVNGTQMPVSDNFLTIHDVQAVSGGEGEAEKPMTLEVVFTKLESGEQAVTPKEYTVSIDYPNDLTVSPWETTKVVEGSSLTISVVNPKPGWKLTATDEVNGQKKNIPVMGNSIEIGNIRANHIVKISQEQIVTATYHTLSVTSDGPGTTSPAGTTLAVDNQEQTLTLIPNPNMKVRSVYVDDDDKTDEVNWTTMSLGLGRITKDTKVEVSFCDPSSLGPHDVEWDQPPADAVYYDVTTSVSEGSGIVMPSASRVASGGSVDLSILPSSGYKLKSFKVNGVERSNDVDSATNTYKLTSVDGNRSVEASFEKTVTYATDDFYTLFVNVNGSGGSVSPAGAITVAAGGSQSITIMPDPGYEIDKITAKNGSTVISEVTGFKGSSYTFFSVTQDMNVIVTFKTGSGGSSILTHDIVATSTVEGRISPEGTIKVADAANATFSFVPNPGYKLSYVNVDGRSIPASYILNNQYIFANVREDHTLHAVFAKEDFDVSNYATITLSKTANGVTNPSGQVLVHKGDDRDIQISPFFGYQIDEVTISENNEGTTLRRPLNLGNVFTDPDGHWSFDFQSGIVRLTNIQDDMTITPSFGPSAVFSDDDEVTKYIPVSASTTGEGGAGGSTILGNGGYVTSPAFDDPDYVTAAEYHPQITITPNEDSMIEKVTLTYGDGSKTVVTRDGTREYDSNGNELVSEFKPAGPAPEYANTVYEVYNQGYVLMDGVKAVQTNGITCDVVFCPLNQELVNNGTLHRPEFFELYATGSGGGRIFPEGRQKVANHQDIVVQFLPSNGYELASVLVDGVSVMNEVMSNKTRTYVFHDFTENHTIEATFTYVGENIEYKTIKATAKDENGNIIANGVSPQSALAPVGSDPIVYLFPPQGMKVANVTVTVDGKVELNDNNYVQSMYVANAISGNVEVEVTYAPAGDDDVTWTVQPVTVTAEAMEQNGQVLGEVSPVEAAVPAGSPQTFFFKPNKGYLVDYVIFNNIAYTLKDNPTSFTVTPSAGADNHLQVYFREATARDKKFVTLTPTLADGSHATIEPTSQRVELGGTATFYVSPDERNMIKDITVDGWSIMDSSVRPALKPGQQPVTGLVYETYIVTIENVQENTNVVVTTETTNKPLQPISKHQMTIKGENVLYNPMGTVTIPEGGNQTITANPLAGYYLDSVIVTDRDSSGNVVSITDMTESLRANQITVPMEGYDREVYIKYVAVGSGSADRTPVNITLGNTVTDKGQRVDATISMQRKEDGTLVALKVDEATRQLLEEYTNEDGEQAYRPLSLTRGSMYTFYASAEPLNGKELILSGATYNGNEQNVPNLTGMIANMKLNASGTLDLVFRELKEGEKPVVTQFFDVTWRVVGNRGGSVSPSHISVPAGSSTGDFDISPSDDGNWMIQSIVMTRYTKDGQLLNETTILPREYKYELFNFTPTADTVLDITFVECALVDVQWDQSLGLVAPNPGKDYLKIPAGQNINSFEFIVAPFENCFVDKDNGFVVTTDDGDEQNLTNALTQSKSVVDYLEASGYKVKNLEEGAGIDDPDTVYDNADTGNEESTISTMAFETRDAYDPIDYNGFVPAQGTVMQSAYSVSPALSPVMSTVNVGLYSLNKTYTIRAEATGPGRIQLGAMEARDGSFEISFNAGFPPSFNLIADKGYQLTRLYIDDRAVSANELTGNGSSYTFSPLDSNHTIKAEFGAITGGNDPSRLLRVASRLAQTGDLTGPAVGTLLLVAALGLTVTGVSYVKRQQRRRRRMQGRA